MARRYDHSREKLNEMAIDATRMIVSSEGVRALSTRKVAKEIGYSVGTIYNLFENLDDLIVHLNGTTLDALHGVLSNVPISGRPENNLRQLASTYIKFTRENLNLWNSLFDHRLPPGENLPKWYTEKIERLLLLIEQAIAPVFSEDEILACKRSAWVLWSSLHGICSLSNSEKLDIVATESATQLTDHLITNYMAGLRANCAADKWEN